jgi:hypothetical protein
MTAEARNQTKTATRVFLCSPFLILLGNLADNLISVSTTRIRWLLMMNPELLRNTESDETPNRDVLYRGSRTSGQAQLGHGDSVGVGLLCAQSLIRPMRNVPIHTEPNVHSGTHPCEGLDSR